MSDNKRYYWIKLKTDFFNQETIDFMLSQKNGCEYVVLYQMLCLRAANNNGELSSKVGEILIPYDVEKIVRDTKYFDFDTVVVALDLFKKLGLIYEEENKILKIANFNEMVGSETKAAQIKRKQRENNIPLIECKRLNNEMLRLPNGNTVFVDEKRYGGNGMLAYDLAGGKCEICGSEDNLCIHHNNGYSNDLKDLYILCRKCHSQLENNKEGVEIVHHYVHQEIEYRDKSIDIDNREENNILICSQPPKFGKTLSVYEQEFEELWKLYPKKTGKKDALKHYIAARKKNTSYEQILKGIENYKQHIERNHIEERYIKGGSSWFCEEKWNDEYKEQPKKQDSSWVDIFDKYDKE